MTNRMLVALGTALALVGLAVAQTPTPLPPPAVMERPVPVAPSCPCPAAPCPTPSDDCGPIWVGADYILGYVYGTRVEPLVTTNPVGTPRAVAGVFGNPTTVSLFHGRVNADERSGARLEGGWWFDDKKCLGVEAGYSVLESQSTLFSGFNDGSAILARPYTNSRTNVREAFLVTFPNQASGGIDIRVSSGNFYEGHIDVVENFCCEKCFRLDGMIGYRYYRYDEGVRIRQITVTTNDPVLARGTQVFVGDDFATQNEFNGCEIGLRGTILLDSLSVEFLGKVAGGNLRRRVTISGGQQITTPDGSQVLRPSGLFALSSNIGQYNFNDLSSMPELGINLRYRFTDNIRLRAGYNILFLNSISRADQQIDSTINPNLIAGSGLPQDGQQKPAPTNLKDNIWIMNISLGLEVMF